MRIRIRILLLIVVMGIGLQTLNGSILSLHASIVSVHGPPWLHFEPIKLLNFYFNAELDPVLTFHSNADPDPQPWFCFIVGTVQYSINKYRDLVIQ
jgi:hypothetical protein